MIVKNDLQMGINEEDIIEKYASKNKSIRNDNFFILMPFDKIFMMRYHEYCVCHCMNRNSLNTF